MAELHGGLCGRLAGGGEDTAAWPARVLADPALPAPAPGSALDGLRRATVAQLGDGEFSFELLLGDDDLPLRQRAQALFDWCRSFLGGFGLAAGAQPPLSEEGAEALQDLARLAGALPQGPGPHPGAQWLPPRLRAPARTAPGIRASMPTGR